MSNYLICTAFRMIISETSNKLMAQWHAQYPVDDALLKTNLEVVKYYYMDIEFNE